MTPHPAMVLAFSAVLPTFTQKTLQHDVSTGQDAPLEDADGITWNTLGVVLSGKPVP